MKKIVFGVIALAIWIISWCSLRKRNAEWAMALAQCLTEKWAIFYGTERCSHCQDQKAMFGAAMSGVTFVDCDKNGEQCNQAGIDGYPTRVFADGSRGEGTQTFEELAAKAGCEYTAQAVTGS